MPLRFELVDALKRHLRARRISYAQLARSIELSEATVKRMFSRQAMTLERLEQICTALGIGLAELLEYADAGRQALTELSAEQEEELVSDPRLLLALYLSLNRWQEDEVLVHYRFTRPEWTQLLAHLDRMGLIELQPGNRVRPRTARNFQWRADGPIHRLFVTRLLPDYFTRPFGGEYESLKLLTGMVSKATALQLRQRMDEAARDFDLLLANDLALPAPEKLGVSLVLAVRPWQLKAFDRWRRETGA